MKFNIIIGQNATFLAGGRDELSTGNFVCIQTEVGFKNTNTTTVNQISFAFVRGNFMKIPR